MPPGEELFRTRDALGAISVHQAGDRRSLRLGSPVEQSGMLINEPAKLLFDYTRAMMLGAVFMPDPRQALILGLGGGSLARALHSHFPRCRITAVERRSAVVDVARRWFFLPDDARLGVHVGDAIGFLIQRQPQADLIFADLYDGEGMDAQLTEPQFLMLCRAALRTGGVAVFNLWSGRYFRDQAIQQALEATFDGHLLRLGTSGRNRIVFAFARSMPDMTRQELCERAEKLGARMGLPLDQHAGQLWDANQRALNPLPANPPLCQQHLTAG
jgi:spermidine synthase